MQVMERSMIVASLEDHISEVQQVLSKIPISTIERVVQIVLEAYHRHGHLYILGNGGGPPKMAVHQPIELPSISYGVVDACHLVLQHAITESTRAPLLE